MTEPKKQPIEYAQAFFWYTALIKSCDALFVILAWRLCWILRFSYLPSPKGIPSSALYDDVVWLLAGVFIVVFHAIGAYRPDRIHFGARSLKKITQGSILATLVFIAICYFRGTIDYSRVYLVIFAGISTFLISSGRIILDFAWRSLLKKKVKRQRVLLVGNGGLLQLYYNQLQKRRPYPIEWVGRVGEDSHHSELSTMNYLGPLKSLLNVIDEQNIDQVVFSFSPEKENNYAGLMAQVSNELVTVKVIPDFGKFNTFSYRAEDECGVPLLLFNQTPVGNSDRVIKRLFDSIGGFLLLILFSPLMFLIGLLIKLDSPGPVFFSQRRIGADDLEFEMLKFRSMRTDAEKETGAVWARKDDNRTTPLGKVLRKTSLDELPQLINVIKGEMSLVGPRPERPVFVKQFRKEFPKYQLRHKMKSGMTGWAQINGLRGNTSLEARLKYDLYYIGHWSHYLDIKILVLTLFKGFVNRHAY